jgi:hypothetical protein
MPIAFELSVIKTTIELKLGEGASQLHYLTRAGLGPYSSNESQHSQNTDRLNLASIFQRAMAATDEMSKTYDQVTVEETTLRWILSLHLLILLHQDIIETRNLYVNPTDKLAKILR